MIKIIFFIFIYLFLPKSIFAIDTTIICPNNDSNCYFKKENILINLTNLYPGFTNTQKLNITNKKVDSDCNLEFAIKNFYGSNELLEKILLTVSNNQTIILSQNLSLLSDDKYHSLGTIPKDSTTKQNWAIVFDKNADNNFQNLSAHFDLQFDFVCNPNSNVNIIDTINEINNTINTTLTDSPISSYLEIKKPTLITKNNVPPVLGATQLPETNYADDKNYRHLTKYLFILGALSLLIYYKHCKNK